MIEIYEIFIVKGLTINRRTVLLGGGIKYNFARQANKIVLIYDQKDNNDGTLFSF